jgi:hypothetical protein
MSETGVNGNCLNNCPFWISTGVLWTPQKCPPQNCFLLMDCPESAKMTYKSGIGCATNALNSPNGCIMCFSSLYDEELITTTDLPIEPVTNITPLAVSTISTNDDFDTFQTLIPTLQETTLIIPTIQHTTLSTENEEATATNVLEDAKQDNFDYVVVTISILTPILVLAAILFICYFCKRSRRNSITPEDTMIDIYDEIDSKGPTQMQVIERQISNETELNEIPTIGNLSSFSSIRDSNKALFNQQFAEISAKSHKLFSTPFNLTVPSNINLRGVESRRNIPQKPLKSVEIIQLNDGDSMLSMPIAPSVSIQQIPKIGSYRKRMSTKLFANKSSDLGFEEVPIFLQKGQQMAFTANDNAGNQVSHPIVLSINSGYFTKQKLGPIGINPEKDHFEVTIEDANNSEDEEHYQIKS